jgi:hypothetical protein
MSTVFNSILSPQVRVVETSQGYRSSELASHQTVYMIGSSTTGDYISPTQVNSLADFTNVFGSSPSESSVKLFFRNDRRGLLYFVRTPISPTYEVIVDLAAVGDYSIEVLDTTITYTATLSDTIATITSALLEEINTSNVSSSITASSTEEGVIIIRQDNPLAEPVIEVVGLEGDLTATLVTPTTPSAQDYVYAIENSFDYEDEWPQGFIIAPEAFQLLPLANQRNSVGLAMEGLASQDVYDWVAIVDAGPDLTPAQARTEGINYTSPQGHTAFYYPYLIDLEDVEVPSSAAVAGIATRRYREEGFQQPPAGAKYPVLGVKDVVYRVSSQEHDTLNPDGINVVRNLRNKGVVVWGMRSRSSSDFYRFINTRVIMNVLNGTLRKSFDNELFSVIDGQGVLLNSISQTASRICSRLWRGKALFGATEVQAFEVKCDFENNTAEDLELGNVLLEVFAVPVPAMEKLLINTIRLSIGALPRNAVSESLT